MTLSKQELEELNNWLQSSSVDSMPLERPVVPSNSRLHGGEVEVVLGGDTRLSERTQRAYAAKALKAKRKAEADKKRSQSAPKGRFHHKVQEATRRRKKEKAWIEEPLRQLRWGRGYWDIPQEEWDRVMGPIWEKYNPLELRIKRAWGHGTKEKPYTIYSLKVEHFKKGLLYDGQKQFVYDHSQPDALDLEAAEAGGELFDKNGKYFLHLGNFRKEMLSKTLNEWFIHKFLHGSSGPLKGAGRPS